MRNQSDRALALRPLDRRFDSLPISEPGELTFVEAILISRDNLLDGRIPQAALSLSSSYQNNITEHIFDLLCTLSKSLGL
jgi:hypothetical protein